MIEHQKSKYNWEFIFLGANIDAVDVANRFGVELNRAQKVHNDSEGIALNYEELSQTVSCFRAAPVCAKISDSWGSKIAADFKRRRKKT